MRRYAAASHFWRALPIGLADWAWQRRGRLLLARASREVPAYGALLRVFSEPGLGDSLCLATSRRSYVEVYPLEQRARRGWQRQIISFDPSGASVPDCPLPPAGCSSAWPRARDELHVLRQHLVGLLSEWFDIIHRRSLLVLALPEGGGSSRARISQALQSAIAIRRLPVTVVDVAAAGEGATPSQASGRTDWQTLLRHVVGCEQVVLLADPASAAAHAAALARLPVRAGLMVLGPYPAGLVSSLPSQVLTCSVLGADGAGPLIAAETKLSRQLSTLCRANPALSEYFVPDGGAKAFYQALPRGPWLEQADDDLLVTSWGAVPLIRYRLGWRGRLVAYPRLCHVLAREKILPLRQFRRLTRVGSPCWKLPLIAISSC